MEKNREEILCIENLSKKISGRLIIDDISFKLYENEIVGFIGPNGAGKSTVMKCIAGLYNHTNGVIKINGYDIVKNRSKALSKLGISIEYPALYPELTGMEHFKLVASWRNVSNDRIEEMVKFSNLNDNVFKKTKNYSMGMKQKLMLSLIMLSDPDLLVLDEPTNGLDPNAVFDLRKKLLSIKQQGKTILISSHNLDEIEKIVDRVIFIEKGKLVGEKSIAELQMNQVSYLMKVSNKDSAIQILSSHHIDFTELDEMIKINVANENDFSTIIQEFTNHNILIYSIDKQLMDLEDYYKSIYKD